MKKINFILLIALLVLSCTSSKDILYFQDLNQKDDFSLNYEDYKLKPDDILKIDISSENPEALRGFISSANITSTNYTKESIIYAGYKINNEGNIFYPSIGALNVEGKTLTEVRNNIYTFLTDGEYLTNPSVDVKLINASFTILGEVNNPGHHNFNKNNLNIIEAIGIAGDLTINGERKDVKLIRKVEDKTISASYDLTSSDIINHQYFQIFSGDIIIVQPNKSRVKNAGIIGNSGTLLSLLSFILSSIIVISN